MHVQTYVPVEYMRVCGYGAINEKFDRSEKSTLEIETNWEGAKGAAWCPA